MPASTMTALEENARFLTRKRLMRDQGYSDADARKFVRYLFRQWKADYTVLTCDQQALVERCIFTVSY